MTPTQMRALIEQFQDERREALDQGNRLLKRANGLQMTIDGLRNVLAASGDSTDSGVVIDESSDSAKAVEAAKAPTKYPRGAEAVREILRAADREMNVREITHELLSRGWTPRSKSPENATSSNAARAEEVYPEVTKRRGDHGWVLYKYVAPDDHGVSNVSPMIRRLDASDPRPSIDPLGASNPQVGAPHTRGTPPAGDAKETSTS